MIILSKDSRKNEIGIEKWAVYRTKDKVYSLETVDVIFSKIKVNQSFINFKPDTNVHWNLVFIYLK